MENKIQNTNLNKPISVALIVLTCILTAIFILQGSTEESDFFKVLTCWIFTITIFQIFYVISYKTSKKTLAFWLMIILIVISLIFSGVLWYVSQLAKSFNH